MDSGTIVRVRISANGWRRARAAIVSAGIVALSAASSGAEAPTRISLEQAIQLALEHNHALRAAYTTILQAGDDEITANLRPNLNLSWDVQFLPFFNPDAFSHDYLENTAQFDLGVGYLFERGGKRGRRLQAARDQTGINRFLVSDSERMLGANVAQEFISALLAESNLDFARENLDSFQKTIDISESRFKAGDMSEGDLLKIRLQALQFQTDVSNGELARIEALASLRQLVGYEWVVADYDVDGQLAYEPLAVSREELEALAVKTRPDLQAAEQGVTASESQHQLALAYGKHDLGAAFNYSHLASVNTGAFFFNIDLPTSDRNQGEIARTDHAITQAKETAVELEGQVRTDVANGYEALRTSGRIVELYTSGYLKQSEQSRDISLYAYQRGAVDLLDYLDAERSYRLTQFAYREALASYMNALEALRSAVGTRKMP
jgi:outer membrane protein, heavy metal efflux system